jgi:hypothetical protein
MLFLQFAAKLRMDVHLRSLYKCCDGSAIDAVDHREVLAYLLLLQSYKRIREQPRQVFLSVLEVFSPSRHTVPRSDMLKVSACWLIRSSGLFAMLDSGLYCERMLYVFLCISQPTITVLIAAVTAASASVDKCSNGAKLAIAITLYTASVLCC